MSTPAFIPPRLTPEEFKAAVAHKGWSYAALSQRWGITANWLSKLSRDPGRSVHWDDAVRGLPYLSGKP